MINENQMAKALNYLADSDDSFAFEKAELIKSEIARKRARARIFLTTEGSVAQRDAQAETHVEVEQADQRYVECVAAFEKLRARRQKAELVVEVWRSLEASRRRVS